MGGLDDLSKSGLAAGLMGAGALTKMVVGVAIIACGGGVVVAFKMAGLAARNVRDTAESMGGTARHPRDARPVLVVMFVALWRLYHCSDDAYAWTWVLVSAGIGLAALILVLAGMLAPQLLVRGGRSPFENLEAYEEADETDQAPT